MFEQVDQKESFPKREEKVLKFWNEKKIYKQSVDARKEQKLFSFYDGPPFATGLPHYGHLLAGTIKDVVLRYKTMKGYYVPRRFGWDCHGLPVENEVEKAQGLSGAAIIEAYGIAKFNEECRSIVLRYTKEWEATVSRMGRFVGFDNTWRTMDLSFMESVWWVFKQLYDKGLIYEGFKVMPYSAKLGTPLSNFEATDNYKDVDDPSLTVEIKLLNEDNTYLLVWTTTPWTLVSNIAVAVGEDIDYVKVKDLASNKKYIIAQARLPAYFEAKEPAAIEVVAHLKGKDLAGVQYEPLFKHFADLKEKGAFQIIVDGFVTLEDGTGLVHTAPGFGEADFYACQAKGLPFICPVDQNGQFTQEVPEYLGRFVKECDKDIIKKLKQESKVFRHETIRHRYPFCWRTDTPLIYKAVATWFVAVEKIKDKLLQANEQIFWVPEHLKYGRFGKWLEGARDWAISRNRYWGTPIPIFQAEDGETIVLGSVKELEERTKTEVKDLHRHFIDDLTFEHNGKTFKRIPEVFDCWFESGSMPYAQNHYPFENKDFLQNGFPADFIAEGIDQTRAWFYVLTVLSCALFDKPAFKNVIVNGIVLAADGTKMSKRLKNYPDPEVVINEYGADAIRLYLLNSPAVKADDLSFSKAGVEVVLRHVLLPLWNSYSFFLTYARLYNWKPKKSDSKSDAEFKPKATIDRWMISLVNKLVHDVEWAMDKYDLSHAVHPFVDFIDQLTNWYIRRSRRRFWSDEASPDRDEAFQTLYIVLMDLVKIAAPYVPFISDAIYQNLKGETDPESVHLADFPLYQEKARDKSLEEVMHLVQLAVSLGHGLRKEKKLKVRQPLAKAFIASGDPAHLELLKREKDLIADELNVQEVVFIKDENQFVQLKAKPNFRLLGKKIGKYMKQAHAIIENFSQAELAELLNNRNVDITIEGEKITLTPEDVSVERIVKDDIVAANDKEITVALDTHLTAELISQGHAREIVNKVNTLRKELDFDISDRIHLTIKTSDEIQKAVTEHKEFIANEVLALSINFAECEGSECDLNGTPTIFAIKKATTK
jgi:isoleucyl-tRNA synthetase